ncbi:MAG: ATP-binding protein [Planctomycetota bacterium]|nr:ATP-binding protein [Planctomycetota bacterium]
MAGKVALPRITGSTVVLCLGAGAALAGSVLAAVALPGVWNLLAPLLCLAGLGVAWLVWFRSRQALAAVGGQLQTMAASGEINLVPPRALGSMGQVVSPLNSLLESARNQIERLKGERRELQIHARVAETEKHNAEAIIFSISDAVLVTNRYDELLLANEAAEKLLNFKLAGNQRKNVDSVLGDATLVQLIRDTRSHGRSFTRKVVEHVVAAKGDGRTFNVTLSCVMNGSDEVSGVVAVLHDVTREKEISRMKTDFVSNVSHELKTPLASIKAYIEMLVDGEAESEETRQEFYEIISTETDRLHRLIENILNISRIESGVVKVVREPISLSGVAKQVLDVSSPQAKLKNQKLVEKLAPVYYQVEADHDMIYQAVMNLVSNAVKYTPEGGTVTITVGADERRNTGFCEVSDSGLGIPADDLPRIFDKFYRVQANNKMAKGTGLGLTLVKHIVEIVHGGTLSVTSEVGKGSTFRFELPLVK